MRCAIWNFWDLLKISDFTWNEMCYFKLLKLFETFRLHLKWDMLLETFSTSWNFWDLLKLSDYAWNEMCYLKLLRLLETEDSFICFLFLHSIDISFLMFLFMGLTFVDRNLSFGYCQCCYLVLPIINLFVFDVSFFC